MYTMQQLHERRKERHLEQVISRVRWMTFPLFIAGLLVAAIELVKTPPDMPVPAIVIIGLIATVPWLATWTYRL